MEQREVLTVPDDESLLVDSEGPQLGGIDEVALDMGYILNLYIKGLLVLIAMLAVNYISWRRYVKALSLVLLEPSRR
eukprot:CAMPEP_0173392864 /NCGR_PEP_ID=MMETSP1356-20130122/21516_1 /TAXON_ID=77927 ORGANISM="Hemiselmis virescens, Strain PCC157" /NCGR_SAMPLE_ID=MMETSP1356 /ASSEMBLY_ACC=CAM_ASM_000847 /LENGTH=76 /DNA_ID=CAMNT_0014350783 /DNA_START=173 /DNA_END=403 /DNA_ORIENTATION=-